MQILAFIRDRDAINSILDHLGLDGTVPPLQAPRAPPDGEQEDFVFEDEWGDAPPIFHSH